MILEFGRMEAEAIKKGVPSSKVGALEARKLLSKMKWTKEEEVEQLINEIKINMKQQYDNLLLEVTL
jgi:V/A-type H+-transporting ATPase subunit A